MEGSRSASITKRSRASRPKVKSGCRTCKLRGIKCDEAKPVCQRCISTGRVCDGYGIWGGGGNAYGSADRTANLLRLSTHTLPLSTHRVSQQEKMTFDFFKARTSIKLPGVFDSGFWETLVYQISTTEPAVLHALIALGATHMTKITKEDQGSLNDESEYELQALQQYNKAIGHLGIHFSNKSKDSLRVALITCMIFICIEFLRERASTANTHIIHGLKLLSEIQDRELPNSITLRPEQTSIDDYLIEAFTRLNIHSALFGQQESFVFIVSQDSTWGPEYEMPEAFDSIRKARLYLDGLMNGIYYLSVQVQEFFRSHNHIPDRYLRRQELLQASLKRWSQAFDICLPSITHRDLRTTCSIHLLRIYHSMAKIMLSACIRPDDEMIYDSYTPEFANILKEASDLWESVLQQQGVPATSFTADIGLISPLYYAALKCRVPLIRHTIINALLSAPHREGIWEGALAASVARRVLEIEDPEFCERNEVRNDIDHFTDTGGGRTYDVPVVSEEARVHCSSVLLSDNVGGKARLRYRRRCGVGKDAEWEVKTVDVDVLRSKVSSGD